MAARAFRALTDPEADEPERDAAYHLLGSAFVKLEMLFNRVDIWHQEWLAAHKK